MSFESGSSEELLCIVSHIGGSGQSSSITEILREFSVTTERSRLLSCLLYGFLYRKKNTFQFKPNTNLHNL